MNNLPPHNVNSVQEDVTVESPLNRYFNLSGGNLSQRSVTGSSPRLLMGADLFILWLIATSLKVLANITVIAAILIAAAFSYTLCGCSMFQSEAWYRGPGGMEADADRALREAIAIVEAKEGVLGNMGDHVYVRTQPPVAVRRGYNVIPDPDTGQMIAGRFEPPSSFLYAEGVKYEIMLEESIHMIRYQTTGATDHDPRYKAYWKGMH